MSSPRCPSSPPSNAHRPMYPLSAASKIMSSVRRSFSPSNKKRQQSSTTPAYEGNTSLTPSPYRQDNKSHAPPSIEQIAMGLHISRTPHIRPLGSAQHSAHPTRHSTHSISLPPSRPTSASSNRKSSPLHPSLKTPNTASSSSMSHSMVSDHSAKSASLSTITSNTLSTPRSDCSLSSLRVRVPWFSSRDAPSTSPTQTCGLNEHVKDKPRKKAVRFRHIPSQEEMD